jgi:hypothetical protein
MRLAMIYSIVGVNTKRIPISVLIDNGEITTFKSREEAKTFILSHIKILDNLSINIKLDDFLILEVIFTEFGNCIAENGKDLSKIVNKITLLNKWD